MAKNNDSKNPAAIQTNDGPKTLDEVASAEIGGFVQTAGAQEIGARLAAGDLESAPLLFTLEEGQMVTCEVITDGEATIEDVATRQPKTVRNWTIQLLNPTTYARGPKVSILGSAQLDRMLPPFLGCVVVIARGATGTQKNRKQLTEYFVGLDRRCPANKPRLPVIDATATER